MFMRRTWVILRLGIFIGMVLGIIRCVPELSIHGYLGHHMYATSFRGIASDVDLECAVVLAQLLIIFMIVRLATWMGKETGRRYALAGFVLLVLGLVIRRPVVSWCRNNFSVDLMVLRETFSECGLLLAIVLPLALGAIIALRIRFRTSSGNIGGMFAVFARPWKRLLDILNTSYGFAGYLLEKPGPIFSCTLVLFLLTNLLAGSLSLRNAISLKSRPNVIFIMLDTTRADHLGCYGYFRNTSPNIDSLAKDGLRFKEAFSQAPWTSASVASFMSSRYIPLALDYGMHSVPTDTVLLPEVLKEYGYHTSGFVANPLAGAERGLNKGYDYYKEFPSDRVISPKLISGAITELQKVKDDKFFMFVVLMDPHSPYDLHEEFNFYKGYRGKLGTEVKFDEFKTNTSEDDKKYIISLYDSSIAFADSQLSRLFEYLKKNNLYDDTLIVFLADHGEEFGDHGLSGHGLHLYDETLHVPLIIKLPGRKHRQEVRGAFPLVNLLPSVFDHLGIDHSHYGLEGRSVRLSGLKSVPQGDIYSSTHFTLEDFAGFVDASSLRRHDSKYIHDLADRNQELYHEVSDPLEKRNIIKDQHSLAASLRNATLRRDKAIYDEYHLDQYKDKPNEMSDEERTKLRSLGYLQ